MGTTPDVIPGSMAGSSNNKMYTQNSIDNISTRYDLQLKVGLKMTE